jgi:sarcosine oxidase subunit gamma
MPDVELRTPLVAVADLPHRGRDIEIRELPGQGHVNLRGDASQRAFADAVQAICGVALPAKANTVSGWQLPCALWLGPDEWLLRLPGEADAATAVAGLNRRSVSISTRSTT